MNANEIRDRIQKWYDAYYPDTDSDIQIVEHDGKKALYNFIDGEGNLMCSMEMAETFLAMEQSDVSERCDMLMVYELFAREAERQGFEPTVSRKVTWKYILEFLQGQPEEYLDKPALVWLHTPYNLEDDEIGEVVSFTANFDVFGNKGISLEIDTDADIDEYMEGGKV